MPLRSCVAKLHLVSSGYEGKLILMVGTRKGSSLNPFLFSQFTLYEDGAKRNLCLRIGVKQGGCSGMSYTMDFESRANARPDDSIIEYNGFVIVTDPKSLLFLYGMQLDFSDNPNATQTCGCGKSFAAEM
ncbi:unnamed protein product [Spirodela intermedia]|uniref:Core domain-containing protein n=1 Tax=Spirodela intermedia TaxID=51605 RepID=A0A7I8IDZ8_SPIIN|nr:unnamed protein product [Spirodela intermedia]CAA6655851.1 unnamed protein product [Spirodela intermedia]